MTTDWLYELKKKVPLFLEQLKSSTRPGFFRYSLSGDRYMPAVHWGLGNTVFAVKIYATLQLLDQLPPSVRHDMVEFLLSFRNADGSFYDPLIHRLTWLRDKVHALTARDMNNFFHQQTIRAETRQTVSALKMLGITPLVNSLHFPRSTVEIDHFLRQLDWSKPWGAGSHFSHLLFFLHFSTLPNREHLISQALTWLKGVEHSPDGTWYKGKPGLQQRINGAMKIITALKVANQLDTIHFPTQLIDLCLAAQHDTHACDNFNIVYVLRHAHEQVPEYRTAEIQQCMKDRLMIYRQYYYPDHGGFSFLPRGANQRYYGALITHGNREPDIHGTVMFLWGISIMEPLLDLPHALNFTELIS